MGGGKGSVEMGDNPYNAAAAYMAQAAYSDKSLPFNLANNEFRTLMRQSEQGNFEPQKLPLYQELFGLQKRSLESQYQQAKKNLMGVTPEGGNLTGALSNLENQRASTMGALPAELGGNILKDWMDKAVTIGWGGTPQAISGLSSVAQSQNAANMANMQAQAMSNNSGIMGLLGQGIGQTFGSLAGKAGRGIASGGVSK
jgi:hypothetical protein